MADHSCERASSDQDHHPEECNEDPYAIEADIRKQCEVSFLGGAWYEHQEIQTENGHDSPENYSDEDLEALAGPAEKDTNSDGHTHVYYDAHPPGRS
jgi:hypothetical protein